MILTAFLVILYCFSLIGAIDTDYLLITGNIRNTDLYIHNNSVFTIYLESYYFDEKARWILENVDDLINTDIEPLDLVQSSWTGKKDTGKYYQSRDYTKSGIIVFKFKVTNSTMENLPQLKFVYKTEEYDDIHVTVNLWPSEIEKVDIETIEDPNNFNIEGNNRNTYVDRFSDIQVLKVESHSIHIVIAKGEFGDRSLTTGNTWFLDNEDKIESNKSIELLSTASRYDTERRIPEYLFIFKINELDKKDYLPILIFSYKKSKESTYAEVTKNIVLLNKNEKYCTINKRKPNQNYLMKKNEIVLVGLNYTPYPGYDWYIENEEEINGSNSIEIIQLSDDGKAPFVASETSSRPNGNYLFKFQIKETAKMDELPPTLKFIQAKDKSNGEVLFTAELSLKIIEKEISVNVDDSWNEKEINIENNTVLKINIKSYPPLYDRYTINSNEIEKFNVIEFIGTSTESPCRPDVVGYNPINCVDTIIFEYYINGVQNESELPKIKLSSEYNENTNWVITLKLKSNITDCSIYGYKCCSNTNASILYHDDDGDWSIENDDWCIIIKDKKEENENTPRLIRTCKSESLGYPCCKNQELIYTDSHGGWGIEEGQWCGIYSCVYTGSYPVCKNTTKIVYTDTEKWGIENNEWCVLCL